MIVVVDHIRINASVLARLLTLRGYPSTPIFCGSDLFHYLDTGVNPQLVILDMNMPLMNGLECLGKLRANPEWDNIPVIMYSADSDAEQIREAERLGALDYVVKGVVRWEDLFTKIKHHARVPLN